MGDLVTLVICQQPVFSVQGEIMYEVTGVYPAPSFFGLDVEDGGNVRVRIIRDLLTDSLQLTLYQVSVVHTPRMCCAIFSVSAVDPFRCCPQTHFRVRMR